MSTSRKIIITKSRTIHTYAELWQGANFALQAGVKNPQGASWQFLSSLVLRVFSFEANLNHVGSESLACWEEMERLPPLAKLRLLGETLGVEFPVGSGERPLQTIAKLLLFRNTVAHGKSIDLKYQPVVRTTENYEAELHEPLLADWERLVRTKDFAQRALEDVESVMVLLQAGRKNASDNLFTTGPGGGSARVVT